MAEILSVPAAQAEIPLQPSPAHDATGENIPANQNSVIAKIRGASGAVFEKFKIGRGRPRKDGAPKKSDIPIAGEPAPAAPGAPAVGVVAQPANPVGGFLLRRFVVSGIKGAKSVARFILKGKAESAGLDQSFVEKTFENAKPSDELWKNFDESTGLVLQKYNIKTEHDELLCWLSDLGNLFACDVLLYKTFDAEIRRRAAREARERGQ